MKNKVAFVFLSLFFVILLTGGSQKAYYSTMEKFGAHKRDIMVEPPVTGA